MNLLPYANMTFRTHLKDREVLDNLYAVTEAEKPFRLGIFNPAETRVYEGQIIDHTFSIRRIIRYRNSFLPRIKGVITPDINGSIISVKMRLHIVIIIFVTFWCLAILMAASVFLMISVRDGKFNPFILIPVTMLLIGYGATVGAFHYESSKSKLDLQQLFEAYVTE